MAHKYRHLGIPRKDHFPAPWPGNNAPIQIVEWPTRGWCFSRLPRRWFKWRAATGARADLGRVLDDIRSSRYLLEDDARPMNGERSVYKHRHRWNASFWLWPFRSAFRFAGWSIGALLLVKELRLRCLAGREYAMWLGTMGEFFGTPEKDSVKIILGLS